MRDGNAADQRERPLVEWLLEKYPDTPRTRAKQWFAAGRVRVNGEVRRKPHEVIPDPGPGLELLERDSRSLDCGKGWRIHPRVQLLHLDGSVAVVNKGAGLISVPAPGADISALSILQDFLSGQLIPRDRSVPRRALPAPYRQLHCLPVHRLDEYTSGVFCLALNPSARRHLIQQVRTHTMGREYVAFVEGRCPSPAGTWRNWVQLSDDELRQGVVTGRDAQAAGPAALEAITHFEVLAEYRVKAALGVVTQLRLRLETGRKHQIRVQAAEAGLPLLGDRTYNPRCREQLRASGKVDFPRQALHAEVLTLEHPDAAGRRMTWTADWPDDLRALEGALRTGRF